MIQDTSHITPERWEELRQSALAWGAAELGPGQYDTHGIVEDTRRQLEEVRAEADQARNAAEAEVADVAARQRELEQQLRDQEADFNAFARERVDEFEELRASQFTKVYKAEVDRCRDEFERAVAEYRDATGPWTAWQCAADIAAAEETQIETRRHVLATAWFEPVKVRVNEISDRLQMATARPNMQATVDPADWSKVPQADEIRALNKELIELARQHGSSEWSRDLDSTTELTVFHLGIDEPRRRRTHSGRERFAPTDFMKAYTEAVEKAAARAGQSHLDAIAAHRSALTVPAT